MDKNGSGRNAFIDALFITNSTAILHTMICKMRNLDDSLFNDTRCPPRFPPETTQLTIDGFIRQIVTRMDANSNGN